MLGWIVNLGMVGIKAVGRLAQTVYGQFCEGEAITNDPGLCNNWFTGQPEPRCISCPPSQGTTEANQADCLLTVGDTSGSSTENAKVVCFARAVDPAFRTGELCPHSFQVKPHDPHLSGVIPNMDIELDAKVFFAGPDDLSVGGLNNVCFVNPGPDPNSGVNPPGFVSVSRYYLQHVLTLDIDPCHPFPCSTIAGSGQIGEWLCRAFVNNEQASGWRIWCNPIIHGAEGSPAPPVSVLTALRPLDLFPDRSNRQPMLVEFSGSVGSCFQYANQFCYTSKCNTVDKIDCIANSFGRATEQVDALNAVDVVFTGQINGDPQSFPHTNGDDVNVQNAVLKTVSAYSFQVTHGGQADFDNAGLNAWVASEDFFVAVTDPNRPIQHAAFPKVTTNGLRDDQGGTPIKITCFEPFTNTTFEASLRLLRVFITANLNVERRLFPGDAAFWAKTLRMLGSVNVVAQVVVFLEPSAYQVQWPFRFIGRPTNQGGTGKINDLRVEDPLIVNTEHPLVKIIPQGPFGGRIPKNIVWRGLNALSPYGTEPAWATHTQPFDPNNNTSQFDSCCVVLETIHTSPMFAERSDFRGTSSNPRPQLYAGSMSFLLPDAGNQFLENAGFCHV